jgi:hypothetical protein
MGHEKFSYLSTKSMDTMGTSPNFKQLYGESLKDAWFRIKEINSKDPNPCKKEKLHLYFYYGVVPWYRNSIYFVSGGSFVSASPKENSIAIKNLFGNNVEKKEELEDMNTILTLSTKGSRIVLKDYPIKETWIT